MKRRCAFLDNCPAFNYNSGATEYLIGAKGEKKRNDTTQLGSTLMDTMLKEVSDFCDPLIRENWALKPHHQVLYVCVSMYVYWGGGGGGGVWLSSTPSITRPWIVWGCGDVLGLLVTCMMYISLIKVCTVYLHCTLYVYNLLHSCYTCAFFWFFVQLIYDFKDGGGSIGLMSLHPDKIPKDDMEKFRKIGVEMPSML